MPHASEGNVCLLSVLRFIGILGTLFMATFLRWFSIIFISTRYEFTFCLAFFDLLVSVALSFWPHLWSNSFNIEDIHGCVTVFFFVTRRACDKRRLSEFSINFWKCGFFANFHTCTTVWPGTTNHMAVCHDVWAPLLIYCSYFISDQSVAWPLGFQTNHVSSALRCCCVARY